MFQKMSKAEVINAIVEAMIKRNKVWESAFNYRATLEGCDIRDCTISMKDVMAEFEKRSGSNCSDMDKRLPIIDFDGCFIKGVTFEQLNAHHACFSATSFNECVFDSCNLNFAYFDQVKLDHTKFQDCKMSLCYFELSKLRVVDLIQNDCSSAKFNITDLLACNSIATDYNNAAFTMCDIQKCEFKDCLFKHVEFIYSKWRVSKLSGTSQFDDSVEVNRLFLRSDSGYHPPVDTSFVSVSNIGSRHDTTYYDYKKDRVICGCWRVYCEQQNDGGSLEDFEIQVNEIYPEGQYHDEYMNAIKIFKTAREEYLKSTGDKIEK